MSLVQVNVDDDVKKRADAAFARNGITTPMAMKMMITQVANEGRTPLDGVFLHPEAEADIADDIRRDTIREEAKEYGLIPDDAHDATELTEEELAILGLDADEAAI